jgi:adenylate kinase
MQSQSNRNAWLKGGNARCEILPHPVGRPHHLVLLGAPGVGKGTQATLISERLGVCHLSTGDIFRAAKCSDECERTPAMTRALEFMRRGELVPDEIVLRLVSERAVCLRCRGGFLLDGFPRTVAQAEALEEVLTDQKGSLDAVVEYELPLEIIVARLSGRRTCSICKAVFHVDAVRPRIAGICDHCGSGLYQREDDRPESIRVRMDEYLKSTVPLEEYYRRRGLLVSVSAEGTPEQIFERTVAALGARDKANVAAR